MTRKYIDLHLHSTCSDGVHPPEEVVRMAAQAGLSAIALADHDNIDGIDAALAAGRELGVEVISGVELSVVWESFKDIHLLGYGFDHHHPQLWESLREFREFREKRNELIVGRINEKLQGEGREPISFERVMALAGGTVGRPHIARALIEQGHAEDVEAAFQRYLICCNVEKRFFPIDDAISLVHQAGGVAVLAHPPFITPDRKVFTDLLDAFIPLGLDGVEAYNSGSTNADIDWYITQARRRGLIVTGGSDFHGIEGGEIVIGGGRGNLKIPYACLEDVRRLLAKRAG
ncbi:phosphatase [Desulfuromonas versatilis]|uniref:Phosphatase n=1 Tax=Desulfuromonas versatilis TaxID=2802975 RepID=A0ABN6DX75_9BACT|nr:PHP domain-containing protein [Desulfuromonas versatilis]BCR04417.1 phosphatase [Desulfuromonas versatilis]